MASSIPKVIHQIWFYFDAVKRTEPDAAHMRRMQDILALPCNKKWGYKLWREMDVLNLLAKYPKWNAIYNSLPFAIQKVDFARYVILYTFGGVYMDFDAFPTVCLDDLFNAKTDSSAPCTIYLSHGNAFTKVANHVLGSAPKNVFWSHVIDNVDEAITQAKKAFEPFYLYVYRTSGAGSVRAAYTNALKHVDTMTSPMHICILKEGYEHTKESSWHGFKYPLQQLTALIVAALIIYAIVSLVMHTRRRRQVAQRLEAPHFPIDEKTKRSQSGEIRMR